MSDVDDCAKFDERVMDVLYEEEGPEADAARAHVETCARCTAVLSGLKHAREVVTLPPMPVPAGLEERILAAARQPDGLGGGLTWARVLDRFISFAGAYAMRPQVAMGALLMLMVGTSLLMLRARPAGPGAVQITEDGVPHGEVDRPRVAAPSPAPGDRRAAPDSHGKADERAKGDTAAREAAAPVAVAAAPPPAAADQREPSAAPTATAEAAPAASAAAPAAPPEDAAYASAMDDYKARRFSDAARGFDVVAQGGGVNAPSAALHAARATRFSAGCGAALPKLDAVASRYVGTSVAAEASWDAAVCYREVGQIDRARQLFQTLRRVAGYRDRAEKELAALESATAGPPAAAAKAGKKATTDTGF
jgi:hypothetical protein